MSCSLCVIRLDWTLILPILTTETSNVKTTYICVLISRYVFVALIEFICSDIPMDLPFDWIVQWEREMAEFLAEDNVCGQQLLQIVAVGNAIIAEILRVKNYIPDLYRYGFLDAHWI